ncbi:MFS transporter [Geodermatophilus sabuli]|uniref:Predicted arabinose efflux permease, MFS family n=1 Tax=Geodermatophilus sabuli TaxID=1564158 RepID=A0A285EDT9_9ACTN|nr:MFS transporter [Geodermatophilus sabuli]MBB3084493.1 MFS family permease [Geodermatophilus sabuli]SNX97312.1 Predicted arabinose efflux permease, MFS family [Geodermatophilus sabuli]
MTTIGTGPAPARAGTVVLPLALAQFIASYAASNMNVAISTIADDLDTDVAGIQTTITLFTLTMAALMIPGSKLTDIWGRKYCFILGLLVYGAGALLAAVAPGLVLLTIGYSLLEGIGSALMIPPIYILVTVLFDDLKTRAKWFGVVSGAAGLGAAAGPLIGGLVTSYVSWRASFLLQVVVVALIALLARRIDDPPLPAERPHFDGLGAVLSAAGLFLVVFGILQTNTRGWVSPLVWTYVALGVLVLAGFFVYARARERGGRTPLVSVRLFRNRTSNLGLVTQSIQWLVMQGAFFVISVFLQQERGYSAIQTGLMLVPATIGVLISSGMAQRMASRHPQRLLIRAGFTLTVVGLALLVALVRQDSAVWTFWPGLFLMGFGVGAMLTASVNVVQSAWPEDVQGDISGVSRSASNLGSSLGVAVAGSVIVAATAGGNPPFLTAIVVVGCFAIVGWVAALLLPHGPRRVTAA